MHPIAKHIRENPDRWSITKFHCYNRDAGIGLWIANGMCFCNSEAPFNLNMFGKVSVWRAVKWLKKRKILEALEK